MALSLVEGAVAAVRAAGGAPLPRNQLKDAAGGPPGAAGGALAAVGAERTAREVASVAAAAEGAAPEAAAARAARARAASARALLALEDDICKEKAADASVSLEREKAADASVSLESLELDNG